MVTHGSLPSATHKMMRKQQNAASEFPLKGPGINEVILYPDALEGEQRLA